MKFRECYESYESVICSKIYRLTCLHAQGLLWIWRRVIVSTFWKHNFNVNERDPRSNVHYLGSSEDKAWKKNQACTRFEPMTSAIPVQRSTYWANKPTGSFWKPRLGEYTAPLSLCLCQYPPELSRRSGNRLAQERAWPLLQMIYFCH